MACSKYEYVKKFEECSSALLQTYIVVRVDVYKSSSREEDLQNFVLPINSASPTTSKPST
jgi:hypothetical protein